jgi:hypothetical protein
MITYIRRKPYLLFMLLTITVVAATFLIMGRSTGNAKTDAITADTAVYQALEYANAGLPSGKLEGMPSEVRGTLLSRDQASRLSLGDSIAVKDGLDAASAAWVIVFRGKVVAHIEGSADGKIAPKEEQFSQMSVVLDAKTGELLSTTMHAPGDELKADALPILKVPSQAPVELPAKTNHPTTVPEPTLIPVTK